MGNTRYVVQMVGLFAVTSLLGGCLGSGGGGGAGTTNATGPQGYATCNITVSGVPSKCLSYTGSGYQTGATATSTACTGTGFTFNGTPSACSLANSVGTCAIAFGGGAYTVATTLYSTGGFFASVAQSECSALGGTYTNP